MKLLYAIQGTGNGHVARAIDVVPILREYGDLDIFLSGAQADIKLPFSVKYKSKGLSFFFGKSGGIDFYKTFKQNSSKEVMREIKKFPVEKYDLIINDFEPISAWACRRKKIPCIALSHQSAILSKKVPHPRHFDPVGEWILNNYAPVDAAVGFHFARYDTNIYTPVIRKAIREAKVTKGEHYTVYLPAYDDRKLVPLLARISNVRWHIFSKHAKKPYHIGRLSVYPINNEEFVASVVSSKGVLSGAGFETPAEVLFLGKKLLVVPMKKQYEQHYNAAALRDLGVPVIKNVKRKRLPKIQEWIETKQKIEIDYPDITREAIEHALRLGRFSI
ncbi:MAG: glycosyltransferase family protein [Cyclobacteriaceae bacterium]|nr:MAG: glycosyltransferase family protein [Cyclobacteriaceae bacterium]